ncbi:hypothetical protein IU486_09910 [Streptomyces gardneri]|jgi:hypothetical protein|uniref:hypothetical protein n=1 Tax=Nocardia TaxID=1817 RepID=UPI001359D1F6|nr:MULTISPECIES: hypothetical protein [Nocardia]MBF6165087.1 hypothetical protein [Streptomyces gardneri]MBF6206477.1 hypothetical protein [Streptomyces gardneri]UAK32332.1 hypothetical protein K8O92_32405 [Nocardia asteroides]
MVTFLISLAVIVAFATLVAYGTGRAGSSDVIDRDADRVRSELTAMLGRSAHHR